MTVLARIDTELHIRAGPPTIPPPTRMAKGTILIPGLEILCFHVSDCRRRPDRVIRQMIRLMEKAPLLRRLNIRAEATVAEKLSNFRGPKSCRSRLINPIRLRSLLFDSLNSMADFGCFCWERSVYWERLESLTLWNLRSLPSLEELLSSLKSLKISQRTVKHMACDHPMALAAQELIMNYSHLAKATLIGFTSILDLDKLENLGNRIKKLKVYENANCVNTPLPSDESYFLDSSEIEKLRKVCFDIEVLGIDLDKLEHVPAHLTLDPLETMFPPLALSILDKVARGFPRLRELELHSSWQ